MSTYLIGDVQGCFDSLQALLVKINFNAQEDRLGFVGDLINRGPKSLETLEFILHLKNPLIVLGNHDLHFLALYFLGSSHFRTIDHTLEATLNSPHCKDYVNFLLQHSFVLDAHNFAMVHAGIPPQWSIASAKHYSDELSALMQKNPTEFFSHIYGNDPVSWAETLSGWDRARYCVNAFTRMRFCNAAGVLELTNKTDISTDPNFKPWFSWRNDSEDALATLRCTRASATAYTIYFGHWASLEGRCEHPAIFALDTGCAWGGKLSAIRIEDQSVFSVDACDGM